MVPAIIMYIFAMPLSYVTALFYCKMKIDKAELMREKKDAESNLEVLPVLAGFVVPVGLVLATFVILEN